MKSTLSTFVIMKFPNDPYGRDGTVDIYTNYLRSLKAHVIVDSDVESAAAKKKGKNQASRGNSMDVTFIKQGYSTRQTQIEMDLFDSEFYILESYLLSQGGAQGRMELWFGWSDEDGKIYNDYKVPVILRSIVPKVTPTGTALNITLLSSYVATKFEGSLRLLDRILSVSRTFRPGGKARRDADVKRAQEALTKAATQGRNRTNTPKYDENVYYFDRISDIIKLIASQAGINAVVDETPVWPITGSDFTFVNRTPYDMLLNLAAYASNLWDTQDYSADGQYRIWFDKQTMYFKRQSSSELSLQDGGSKDPKKISYLGQNEVSIDDLINKKTNETITIDLDVSVKTLMAEATKTRAVSYDPRSKGFRGDTVETGTPAEANFLRGVLGEDNETVKKANRQVSMYGSSGITAAARSAIVESERLKNNNITPMYGQDNQRNWFINEDAISVAEEEAQSTGANGRARALGADDKAYAKRLNDIQKRLEESGGQEPQGVASAIAKSDSENSRTPPQTTDPTAAGTTIILPFYDSRTTAAAHNLYQTMSTEQTVELSATIIGDPSIRRLDIIDVEIVMPNSAERSENNQNHGPTLHYTSGQYMVKTVDHLIDTKGFTTQITAVRTSTANLSEEGFTEDELKALSNRAEQEQREADASIGPDGEQVILNESAESIGRRNQAAAVQDGPESGGNDFGVLDDPPYVYTEIDSLTLGDGDISSLSPVDSQNVRADGSSLSAQQGPNSRSVVRNLMDPNNALNGGVGKPPPSNIFSMPGSSEEPE